MRYSLGFVFLLLSAWKFIIFKQSFKNLKQNGDKDTSSFIIMLGLWSGLLLAIIFLAIALSCFFGAYLSFVLETQH